MRTLVKDVWDMRQAKLRKGVDQMVAQQETFAKVGHCSINTGHSLSLSIQREQDR